MRDVDEDCSTDCCSAGYDRRGDECRGDECRSAPPASSSPLRRGPPSEDFAAVGGGSGLSRCGSARNLPSCAAPRGLSPFARDGLSAASSSPSLSTMMLPSSPLLEAARRSSLATFARQCHHRLGDGRPGGGGGGDRLDEFRYDGPTTLSLGKLVQGSVLMFAVMAFLNVAVGSFFRASYHGSGALYDGAESNHDLLTAEVIRPPSESIQGFFLQDRRRRGRRLSRGVTRRGGGVVGGDGTAHHPPKGVLGTAAISSVTEWLGPILPFAGGIDLRRLRPAEACAWVTSYFFDRSGGSAATTADGVPRGGGGESPGAASAAAARNGPPKSGGRRNGSLPPPSPGGGRAGGLPRRGTRAAPDSASRSLVLAAAEPFLPVDEIAALTLEEITHAFRYAVRPESFANRGDGESEGGRDAESDARTERLVRAMEEASAESLWGGPPTTTPGAAVRTPPSVPTPPLPESDGDDGSEEGEIDDGEPSRPFGEVDATRFCAALRIFAEWRILRTVPEGYKAYAVGMSLGQKDVVQNVAKIEAVIGEWIDRRRYETDEEDPGRVDDAEEGAPPPPLRGPTLRQLLEYERDAGVHAVLPRLKDNTAAMGLLWTSRQLRYQTAIFQNILDSSGKYPDARAAVGGAYGEVYDRYHGWAVQKIFNYSFGAAPDVSVIFNFMNPHRLKEIMEEVRHGIEGEDEDVVAGGGNSGEREGPKNDSSSLSGEEELVIKTTTSTSLAAGNGQEDPRHGRVILLLDPPVPLKENHSDVPSGCRDDNEEEEYIARFPPLQRTENVWVDVGGHIVNEWNKVGYEVDKLGKHLEHELSKVGSEWDKIASHVVSEWEKLASGVAGIFGIHPIDDDDDDFDFNFGASPTKREKDGQQRRVLEGEELERYVSNQMERNARDHIAVYLQLVKPILSDLAGLFYEMNMNDPTKV